MAEPCPPTPLNGRQWLASHRRDPRCKTEKNRHHLMANCHGLEGKRMQKYMWT